MHLHRLTILAFVVLSASCAAAIAPPPEPQKTVIDAQLKALDKAKAVQQVVDQQKKDVDKKLDEAEK